MKKYTPFFITGLLSAGFALGLFALLFKPTMIVETAYPQTVLTNYTPFATAPSSAVPVGSPDLVKASNQAKAAVVYIESRTDEAVAYFGRRNGGASTGSGVMISHDGYIATNHHVIEGGKEIAVLMDDGREFKAKVIGSDPSTDLALLKVEGRSLPYLTFGNSDSLMVGEWVIAIGNPFRLYSTVTAGIVSAKSRNINILDDSGIESFIQTDAAVNPGNSGGALVNSQGQLMGINTAIMTFSGQYEGFSFAVPSNLAMKVLEDIREFGTPRRGWLGVVIRPVDDATAKSNGLAEVSGVIIERVNESGAADVAGLEEGDIVTSIDGRKIVTSPDFMGKIGQHRPGDVLTFDFIRSGKQKQARVKLSATRTGNFTTESITTVPSSQILDDLGMRLRDLNDAEKNRLPKDGVLVTDIEYGSRIARVNMEEGFIITKINGISVRSLDELESEIKRAESALYLQGYYEEYPGDFAYTLPLR